VTVENKHSSLDLLKEEEVAQLLGRSLRSLRRWQDAGIGPRVIKVMRMVRYRRADVEAWLDEHTRPASKVPPRRAKAS